MERAKTISKSMVSYLKRAREQKEFLLKETKEFERGKRHLANMMGIDSQEMTQNDINEAIEYLFPSGLFEKKARPAMKHPSLIFKAEKEAQFDDQGRPHHYLFYTANPNYYETLSELSRHLRELNKYEDEQLARGVINPPEDAQYIITGRQWLGYEDVCDKLLERLREADYEYLLLSLSKLSKHPYSSRVKSFIDEYSTELPGQSINLDLPKIIRDEKTGKIYTDIKARNRQHVVRVKTVLNGSGKIDIEGFDILFFPAPYMRRAIFSPLQMSGMVDKVDIWARIIVANRKRGKGTVASCVMNSVARSIAAYVDEETRERMRLAGLLTVDKRTRERKKFGQAKARRKYTWKKR